MSFAPCAVETPEAITGAVTVDRVLSSVGVESWVVQTLRRRETFLVFRVFSARFQPERSGS